MSFLIKLEPKKSLFCMFFPYLNPTSCLKGTLMQIWKSPCMLVFIWKQYSENFVFLIVRILELFTREVCKFLNPKAAGWGVNLTPPPHHCGFLKSASSKEREKPWFFVTFNIILRHIFPEIFIEFPQVVQKIEEILCRY